MLNDLPLFLIYKVANFVLEMVIKPHFNTYGCVFAEIIACKKDFAVNVNIKTQKNVKVKHHIE